MYGTRTRQSANHTTSQLLATFSWEEVSQIKESDIREAVIEDTVKQLITLPNSLLLDWTSTIYDELIQLRQMSVLNVFNTVDKYRLLKYNGFHEQLVKMVIHGYLVDRTLHSRNSKLLDFEEAQLQIMQEKEDFNVEFFPFYAAEILSILLEQEPEESLDETIQYLVEQHHLILVLCHCLQDGLFSLRLCCLKIIKSILRSTYGRQIVTDEYINDDNNLLSLIIQSIIEILKLESKYLSEELRTPKGEHQHSILSVEDIVTEKYAIRSLGMLKENASIVLYNIILLNIHRTEYLVKLNQEIVDILLNYATELPSESYPDSSQCLISCNALYALCVTDSTMKNLVTGTEDSRYINAKITTSLGSKFVQRIFKMLKKLKAISDIVEYVRKKFARIVLYHGPLSEYQLDDMMGTAIDNLTRVDTAILNIISEISQLPAIAKKFATINSGSIVELLRIRPRDYGNDDLQMFLPYFTTDNRICLVQPNDTVALAISMKNIYPHCKNEKILNQDVTFLYEFELDACNYVKRKACHCFLEKQYELTIHLLSICLRVLQSKDKDEPSEKVNMKIDILVQRSEANHHLKLFEEAYSDLQTAQKLHHQQGFILNRLVKAAKNIIDITSNTESSSNNNHNDTTQQNRTQEIQSDSKLLEQNRTMDKQDIHLYQRHVPGELDSSSTSEDESDEIFSEDIVHDGAVNQEESRELGISDVTNNIINSLNKIFMQGNMYVEEVDTESESDDFSSNESEQEHETRDYVKSNNLSNTVDA
jgi:hypothetical protein